MSNIPRIGGPLTKRPLHPPIEQASHSHRSSGSGQSLPEDSKATRHDMPRAAAATGIRDIGPGQKKVNMLNLSPGHKN